MSCFAIKLIFPKIKLKWQRMAKEGHLLLTTWHCPVQCVTFVTNSTQTNVRIHSYKVFDTNECLYRYLRFLNSFATRSTANDGWTRSSPKCKMDPTVGQGPSDTDQTGIFSRHWCATICKGSPASTSTWRYQYFCYLLFRHRCI